MADEPLSQVIRTYKYRLLPRKGQHRRLRAALDHARHLYNAALEERIGVYRKTGKSAGYVSQCRALTELRADPEFTEFAVSLQRWPLKRLDEAFAAFFRRVKAGEKPGFPRFRARDRFRTFGFTHRDGWKVGGRRLNAKGIGRVRLHLHRPPPGGEPVSCAIKREAKGWVALLAYRVPVETAESAGLYSVGLDLGLTSFVATSDGDLIASFRATRRAEKELRRRQRALARCKRGSGGRRKAKARVVRLHEHVARGRRTFHHQVAARLVREHGLIAIEDLNVKGLAAGMLAKSVNDAGWSSFTQLLLEKAERAGREVVKVDPRFTSMTCPSCGQIAAKMLAERIHRCDCGCVLDRDVAAAKVILNRAVLRPGVLKLRAA